MSVETRKMLEAAIQELVTGFRGLLEWKWDGRFKTALAEFPIDRKAEVLGVLEKYLVSQWDASSAKEAPETVQEIVKTLGGLMSGQLLLLSDLEKPAFLFCAWWPWGNGQKISIRVGAFSRSPEEMEALVKVLKEQFGT